MTDIFVRFFLFVTGAGPNNLKLICVDHNSRDGSSGVIVPGWYKLPGVL